MTAHHRPQKTAADHIRELTRSFTTIEILLNHPTTTIHHVRHPALLGQLEQTVTGTQIGNEGGASGSSYGSKPAGRIDVLALLHRIDQQSHDLACEHGLETPDRVSRDRRTGKPYIRHGDKMPLRDRLQRLSGVLGDKPHARVRSWWVTARVLTQHDGPPYTPPIICPHEDCEAFGSVRVRFAERIASCVECHTVWADDSDDPSATFGRLAVWCRWSLDHLKGEGPWHLVDDHGPGSYDDLGYGWDLGYDAPLGYLVVCPECEWERFAVGERRKVRQAAARAAKAAARSAA